MTTLQRCALQLVGFIVAAAVFVAVLDVIVSVARH